MKKFSQQTLFVLVLVDENSPAGLLRASLSVSPVTDVVSVPAAEKASRLGSALVGFSYSHSVETDPLYFLSLIIMKAFEGYIVCKFPLS